MNNSDGRDGGSWQLSRAAEKKAQWHSRDLVDDKELTNDNIYSLNYKDRIITN